ncbi:Methyltransferase-like protein 22 [Leucoagaricus sp. SymC.cos]|nr:Methyltransferase-like protein 22 [Leucoagaricus sp. SymC.cos]
MSASCPAPAHTTKHVPVLRYPFVNLIFHLSQSQNGESNGTALWLGAQCLAAYLAESHARYSSSQRPPRAIELGSGIGLTALALSSLGWDVVATDTPHVIISVLNNNIRNNQQVLPPGSGHIVLRELDWLVQPGEWLWDHPDIIASRAPSLSPSPEFVDRSTTLLAPLYDLIYTADTIYDTALVTPLLRSLHVISALSAAAHPTSRAPPILLCLERRDPALVEHFIQEAAATWHFFLERVPHRKFAKAVQKHNPHWTKEDWEGVELWKLRLITSPRSVDES